MTEASSRLATALADHYRIERELGAGGMATVYLAQDLKHQRKVAIKVLRPELTLVIGAERFLVEIRTTANLQHPHILPLHDSGEADSFLYYVMPYVEGESLRDRLNRETQLSVADAVRIATEVASALDYAHRHGVIHRDIKPENILLHDGSALVADFGIARALERGEEERLTGTGMAIGTPAYMSPEQASGERKVDGRTDQYAMACVLYEMLAGEPPFTGPTAHAVIARALTERPRPIHPMRSTVSEALDGVIARAMAVTLADRYSTVAEFARALEGAATSPPLLTPAGSQPRHRRTSLILLLVLLLGLGGFLAWRLSGRGQNRPEHIRLAVLPFENLGDTTDAYFADGLTDAIRGKLTALRGFQVIARGSSIQYRNTTETPRQIGQELGVKYLLTGTVRWEKRQGDSSRLQVSPELIQTSTAAARWQQPFDAVLSDVFQVQADIAGRVAQALDVTLGNSAQQQLTERPTRNLAAYDAYLRGEEARQAPTPAYLLAVRRAVTYYQEAVALDSTFVRAWAQLAMALSRIQDLDAVPSAAEDAIARHAAERALALAPDRAESHLAMGSFRAAFGRDFPSALNEFQIARQLAPQDAEVLTATARAEQRLGRWEDALGHFREAQALDPRSVQALRSLSFILLNLRRYPEALTFCQRIEALIPGSISPYTCRINVALGEGNLAAAQTALAAVPQTLDPALVAATVATYGDLYWILDDTQQQMLLRLSPGAFDDDRANWGIVLAQTYWLRGDHGRARAYADSARLALEQQLLRASPPNALRHALLGLALAYLGRNAEAVSEGERAVALVPPAERAEYLPYVQHQLVRIYILTGEETKALDLLEHLLRVPYFLSRGRLKIDPNFDPLRDDVRFQRLIGGTP